MLYLIIGILIVIVIAAILFTILKSIIKAILFTLFIVAVLGIIFGIFIITDANTFKQKMDNSQNTYLFINDNIAIQGVRIKNEDNNSVINPIGSEQLEIINEKLKDNDLKEIKGSDYKLIFIKSYEKNNTQENFEGKMEETFSNPANLIKNIKSGNLRIYPENTMFKVLKYIPDQIINLASKLISKKG